MAAVVVLGVVALQLGEGWPVLRAVGVRGLFAAGWHPTEHTFGLGAMLGGTIVTTAGALVLAAPLGVCSAVFERFYAPRRVAAVYRRLIEVLAGVPSVVVGFWGLVTLVPIIARLHPPGASVLAAIVVLALMVLPTVALVTEASLRAVPPDYLNAAAALGLTRWAVVRRIALPVSRPGIVAGITLAIGRALGETMAVLMVAGNVVQMPRSIFDPTRTLTANIALEMPYAQGLHRSALFAGGLALTLCVLTFIVAAEVAHDAGRRTARGMLRA